MGVSVEARTTAVVPSIEISRPFSSLERSNLDKLNSLREKAITVASEVLPSVLNLSSFVIIPVSVYLATENIPLSVATALAAPTIGAFGEAIEDRFFQSPN